MFTYNMKYSKCQPKPIIIKIRCAGIVESYAGFDNIQEAFKWLEYHRRKYAKA